MAQATAMRTMSVEDLYRLRFAHKLALSPDGTRIAFSVMRPDEASNSNRYRLAIISATDGQGETIEVVSDEPQEPSPDWSPDGSQLAFIAGRGAVAQVCVFDLQSRQTRQVTSGQYPASAPLWSPDGSRIAYQSALPSVPSPWYPVAYEDPTDTPKVITRSRYKFDGMGWFSDRRSQLFVVPAAGGEARQLTKTPPGIGQPIWTSERGIPLGGPAWSNDGSRLAYVASVDQDEERDGRCDVWTVAVESGELTRVTPNDGLYGCPAWSPDDQTLAVVGAKLPKKGGANAWLWTAPASGGDVTRVTDADLCVGVGPLADNGAPTRTQPAWIGDTIYFSASEHGAMRVWRVNAGGGQPEAITPDDQVVGTWALDRSGQSLAYIAATPTNPGEVYRRPLTGSEPGARCLTQLNHDLLSEMMLSEPEMFWTTAPDGSGTRVQGWVMRPPSFSPGQQYPCILEIHGGPHTAYGYSWFHEFQCYAAQGYVIVYSNPRGSVGYGEDFATSIYLDWGSKPMVDVMAALDHAAAQGYVDPERLYVTGGSYGGYMVNWIVTHTDRFRAAATGRCVSDLHTLALACDNGTMWMDEYFGGMPWQEPEVYRFGSPISHIDNCQTPLFIEHQEMDQRCTMDQAEQMYNALRLRGIETEMVLYPKEPHGMSRGGQPRHRVDRLIRTLDWFRRHGGA